jgi:hypothetical protein
VCIRVVCLRPNCKSKTHRICFVVCLQRDVPASADGRAGAGLAAAKAQHRTVDRTTNAFVLALVVVSCRWPLCKMTLSFACVVSSCAGFGQDGRRCRERRIGPAAAASGTTIRCVVLLFGLCLALMNLCLGITTHILSSIVVRQAGHRRCRCRRCYSR